MRNFIAAACLLATPLSLAQAPALRLTITWDIPTTREDGSPLPANEYGGALIRWGQGSGAPYDEVTDVAGASTETIDNYPLLWDTEYCFIVEAYDTAGRLAMPTPEQCVTTPSRPIANPSVATNVRLTVEIV